MFCIVKRILYHGTNNVLMRITNNVYGLMIRDAINE